MELYLLYLVKEFFVNSKEIITLLIALVVKY